MSEDGEKKAAAAAPPAGLFGDDSSSSEEDEEAPAAAAAEAPAAAPAAEGEEPMDTDDKPAAAGDTPQSQSQPTSNAALFGDEDSSSDEEEVGVGGGTAAASAPAATEAPKESAEAATESAPAAASAKPTSNAGLFGDDDSDDDSDDEDEVAFDDIKGRSATDAERAAMTERAADLASKSVLPGSADAEMGGADTALGGGMSQQSARQTDGRGGGSALRKKEPRRLEVLDIPRPADIHKSSKMSLHVTKLPNLVGIQSQPYDPDTHDPEQEEQDYRGYTHSMIRWRYKKTGGSDGTYDRDENGKLRRDSNARFVKWSDGTYTLHVGPEVFEVDQIGAPKTPAPGTARAAQAAKAQAAGTAAPSTYPGLNGYVYLTQTVRAAQSDATGEPLPDLVDRTILECQGPITSRLVPRPSSLQSSAHKNLTLAVRQRNMKKARIQEMVTTHDPELEKAKRMKANEDLAKQEKRKGGARHGGGGGGRRPGGARVGMNRRYLEDDDDDAHYDTVNVSRMKRRMMDKDESMDYGVSSGEEEDEWSQRKRAAPKKKPVQSSSEEEFDFGDDDDDEEEAVIMSKNKAAAGKKRTHQAIDDDDDDDD
mmetsp:Transcript_28247/g.81697  ORF Transcript_28247/g.81697 Transcript_28247/m.81697 type:complete len:595 (-) Transcript_28247:94-1878(-)